MRGNVVSTTEHTSYIVYYVYDMDCNVFDDERKTHARHAFDKHKRWSASHRCEHSDAGLYDAEITAQLVNKFVGFDRQKD